MYVRKYFINTGSLFKYVANFQFTLALISLKISKNCSQRYDLNFFLQYYRARFCCSYGYYIYVKESFLPQVLVHTHFCTTDNHARFRLQISSICLYTKNRRR